MIIEKGLTRAEVGEYYVMVYLTPVDVIKCIISGSDAARDFAYEQFSKIKGICQVKVYDWQFILVIDFREVDRSKGS